MGMDVQECALKYNAKFVPRYIKKNYLIRSIQNSKDQINVLYLFNYPIKHTPL
jgi:hypothetical protein